MLKLLTLILVLALSPVMLYAHDDGEESINTQQSALEETEPVDDAGVPVTQENAVNTNPFTIELYTGTQSPWTGKVPVTLKFRANIDSERTELQWDTPNGVSIETKHPRFVSAIKGETYTYQALISPSQSGSYNIATNVTSWQVQTNYTSSSSIILTFNEDLVAVPQADGYSTAVLLKNIVLLLAFIGLTVLLYYLGKIGFEKFKIWLKPPQ